MSRHPRLRSTPMPKACLAAALGLVTSLTSRASEPSFTRDVLPILAANCLSCHGFDAQAREAGLRLDNADGATAVLESGRRAVVPGDLDASELIRRIESDEPDERMPPPDSGRSLSPEQRSILRGWVAAGGDYQRHWAFVPPVAAPPPGGDGAPSGGDHSIDRFVDARLVGSGLDPAPEAGPETLLRRLHLDLIGLPPTVAEIDAYLARRADDPEAAFHDVVDRLLASPHYGERLARWWLDMARYADSNGYSVDAPREIWPWRDWVIDAFNDDMPFDRFTVEQLAGDLLPAATARQRIATGFHRNTPLNQEGGIDKEQFRVEGIFDRVATTGVVWLGMSIGCAQCHDHKFDPISQRDYYRLFAFFNSQDEPSLTLTRGGEDPATLEAAVARSRADIDAHVGRRVADLVAWESGLDTAALAMLPASVRMALEIPAEERSAEQRREVFAAGPGSSDEAFVALQQRHRGFETRLAALPSTLVLQERPQPRRTTILVQGDFTRPADEVTPGTPAVLPAIVGSVRANRLDLARWIVDPGNPLTSRVLVNRVWQRLFGSGLVETENDFGLMGSMPSHPELLDWLAVEFVNRGWSIKQLHRLIVTSRTYRQRSDETPAHAEIDPRNRLLARQRRLRLDAEIVRDVALVASGLFVPTIGGPPVFPPIPAGVTSLGQVGRTWDASTGPNRYRRGLYTFVYRATPPPALSVFDAPEGIASCTRRSRSNTPLQALTLLNDTAFVEMAEALAAVIDAGGVEAAFRRCTGRRPDDAEAVVLSGLESLEAARVLLNLDETVTRE